MAQDNSGNHYGKSFSGRHSNQSKKNTGKEHSRFNKRENHKNTEQKPFKSNLKDSPVESPRLDTPNCAYCGEPIYDLPSAMCDRDTLQPVHFDCVLKKLNDDETLNENEKITYIGQGRFGVVYFENPHDLRHFKIERIIEWEDREKKADWRSEIASKFSQTK